MTTPLGASSWDVEDEQLAEHEQPPRAASSWPWARTSSWPSTSCELQLTEDEPLAAYEQLAELALAEHEQLAEDEL